jgi:hypothetical protein
VNKRHSYSPADWLEAQRHQPAPEDEDSWRDRMRERRLDDKKPPQSAPISSKRASYQKEDRDD